MSKHVTEPNQSLIMLDYHAKKVPDWSLLPGELLHLISTFLDNFFDVVHARSVCSSWRSSFPFPSYLLRPSYRLPMFVALKDEYLCTLVKVPLFLFRVLTPFGTDVLHYEYFLGGIRQDDHMELLPSPVQCSVKSDQTMNMLDCQIIPLGHQYRMIGWEPKEWAPDYRHMACLSLNKEGAEEIVVLLYYCSSLFVLRSAEMRWMKLKKISNASCEGLVSFRGRFYAVFLNGDKFVIDPHSLEATRLIPLSPHRLSSNILVACGNDELFFVELDYLGITCRVSRLDEEAGKWVVVNDLGDRVLFLNGDFGNICCSAKEIPGGCGVSGNSILFTQGFLSEPFFYKYGVNTGNVEDYLSLLRISSDKNCVTIFNEEYPVLALRVEC